MNTFEPFKYLARAILVERDESGEIVAEHSTDEFSLYSKGQVERWLEIVDELAPNINQQSNGE